MRSTLTETNNNYKQIHRLADMLGEAGVPYTKNRLYDGWIVVYLPHGPGAPVADAVEHSGSYGSEKDLFELMGLLTEEESEDDAVVGYLTAEEVFKRIYAHWMNMP